MPEHRGEPPRIESRSLTTCPDLTKAEPAASEPATIGVRSVGSESGRARNLFEGFRIQLQRAGKGGFRSVVSPQTGFDATEPDPRNHGRRVEQQRGLDSEVRLLEPPLTRERPAEDEQNVGSIPLARERGACIALGRDEVVGRHRNRRANGLHMRPLAFAAVEPRERGRESARGDVVLDLRERLQQPDLVLRVRADRCVGIAQDGCSGLGDQISQASAGARDPLRRGRLPGDCPRRCEGLARELSSAESGLVYGRMGTSVQAYGVMCNWLIGVLNLVTGNLDRPGGTMLTAPALDPVGNGMIPRWDLGNWTSRVRGLPEFGGEQPVATFADELLTPGRGQVRGLVTLAGNPVLSTPDGPRLERALQDLDFFVSLDCYVNETSRHADLILPPVSHLEARPLRSRREPARRSERREVVPSRLRPAPRRSG